MTEKEFLELQAELRPKVNSLYDMQKQRIAVGGRIVSEFYAKMGIKPGKKIQDIIQDEDPEDEETQKEQKKALKVLDVLKLEYKRVTDLLAKEAKKSERDKLIKTIFTSGQLITNQSEMILSSYYFDLCRYEKQLEKEVSQMLLNFEVWNIWLSKQYGIGPRLGGALLSRLNPFISDYPSSWIRYLGLDVGPDGKGTSRRKIHMIKKEYVNKKGETKEKDSLTYNPWLKAKFVSTCKMNFIKKKSPWREMFENYLYRYSNHRDHKDKPKMHLRAMALRLPMKQFVINFWLISRSIHKLPATEPYHIAKLGLIHKGGQNDKRNNNYNSNVSSIRNDDGISSETISPVRRKPSGRGRTSTKSDK